MGGAKRGRRRGAVGREGTLVWWRPRDFKEDVNISHELTEGECGQRGDW